MINVLPPVQRLNKNLIHGKNVRLAALEISTKIIIAQEDRVC
jgi:hypothetical protein